MYVFLIMLALRISLPLTRGLVVTFNICDYTHLGVRVAEFLSVKYGRCVARKLVRMPLIHTSTDVQNQS